MSPSMAFEAIRATRLVTGPLAVVVFCFAHFFLISVCFDID
jgi:hypothetical protein